MKELEEICKLTGLSQSQLADWLGISRTLLFLIMKGKRKIPNKVFYKVAAMMNHLRETKQQAKTGKALITDHAKLAAIHQEKMNKYRKSAATLQSQLDKLQLSLPLMQTRQSMFDHIKASGIPGYQMSYGDELMMKIIENDSKDPAKQLVEMELLQDTIETHLAYSDLHEQRWKEYMAISTITM